MERLINILPNLISNEDTEFLQKTVRNPDVLTRELIEDFSSTLYQYAIENRMFYKSEVKDLFKSVLSDNSKLDDLIYVVKESEDPIFNNGEKQGDEKAIAKLFEELKQPRFNCQGKSLTSIIWAAAILNNYERKGVNEKAIKAAFVLVSNTMNSSKKDVKELVDELRSIFAEDQKLLSNANESIAISLLKNPNVQDSNAWYNFYTLEKLNTENAVEIKNNQELFSALKSPDNYIAAYNYVKEKYLSDKTPGSDGFCLNENDRNYKACIILAVLASELNKEDENFDKDNTIGLNLATELLYRQQQISEGHILNDLTNFTNNIEDAAGRIACTILGRQIELGSKPRVKIGASNEKKFTKESYIRKNLTAFRTLIKSNMKYCQDIASALDNVEEKYKNKVYKNNKSVKNLLNYISNELNTEIDSLDDTKEASKTEILLKNVKTLREAALKKYDIFNRMLDVFTTVRKSQNTNLDIEELVFDQKLLRRNVTINDEYIEKVIKEFYKFLSADPALSDTQKDSDDKRLENSSDNEDKYRLKTTEKYSILRPKQCLKVMKDRLGDGKDYTVLKPLFGKLAVQKQTVETEKFTPPQSSSDDDKSKEENDL